MEQDRSGLSMGEGSGRNAAAFDARYGISNMKDLAEDDNEDSPRASKV